MTGERLQILKMVQEGKLSAEQAVKLLDAVELPAAQAGGPKASRVRVNIVEAGKTTTFFVSAALAQWVLKLDSFHTRDVREAIGKGAPGKVFEVAEGGRRLEIWLEA